jgi:crossover junction endodeoxyribonuclease RuvC
VAEIHDGVVEPIDATSRPSFDRRHLYARNVRNTAARPRAWGNPFSRVRRQDWTSTSTRPRIKKAVAGTGAATKLQIQFMVTRLLRSKSAPQPSDAADGVAAALAYADAHLRRSSRSV